MKLTVDPSFDRHRLDIFLAAQFPAVSRSFLQSLCKTNQVLVNGKPEKSGYKLHWNDSVEILHDMASIGAPPEISIPILYEDDDVVVVNKPAGLLSHALSKFKDEPSVASFLRQKGMSKDENIRFGIIHRLDRQTSGVMVCGKNAETVKYLQHQFANRTVSKQYFAVVDNSPKHPRATIDVPIERNPKKPATFRAGSNGKPAETYYEVKESGRNGYLIKVEPKTGRTHQIRVHLHYINCPVVGDVLYAGRRADRLFLHAASIQLYVPNTTEPRVFEAPLPEEFLKEIGK
jgi:23S rRNA pseudouridine1911/1915/1917 synthase